MENPCIDGRKVRNRLALKYYSSFVSTTSQPAALFAPACLLQLLLEFSRKGCKESKRKGRKESKRKERQEFSRKDRKESKRKERRES